MASPVIMKTVNMSFINIMLYHYFSLEAVLQGVARNNPTEKCANMQSLSLQIAKIDLNYEVQLLAFEYQT